MDAQIIRRAVEASQTTVFGIETGDIALDVLAVFDHDWERHVVSQHWDYTDPTPRWVYCLWFLDADGAVLVRTYRTKKSPLISAAALVECWKEHRHYGGQSDLDISTL